MLMKTSRILLLGAAAVLSAACTKDEVPTPGNGEGPSGLKPMTFTADAVQTRTQLAEGNAVHWTAGDKIAVWDGTSQNEFTAKSVNGSSATFEGLAAGSDNYTAFYPFDAVTGMDNTSITFTLPSVQTAVAGSFAPDLAPSWAQATGGSTSLKFHNLCALVKFTVGADMAGKGSFTLVGGNATEELAGTLSVTTADGSLSVAENAATRITLKGNFEAGKAYYIVVAPGTLENGFSLLYEDKASKLYRKATGKTAQLQAGHILNLGTLSLTGFLPAITTALYDGGTQNADGTSTLEESDLTAIATKTYLSEHNYESLTTFAGIGYYSGLTWLECYANKLTELNVSGLTKLEILQCGNNQLTSLDVSSLANLKSLGCGGNKLTSLDVSGLTKLETLECSNNQLTMLNISNLPALTKITCNENYSLTSLELNNLPKLDRLECYRSGLTSLSISATPELTYLDCNMGKLISLDASGLSSLTYLNCSYNYSIASLKVSGLSSLQTLQCYSNKLESLDLRGLTSLTHLACNINNFTSLDVSGATNLKWLECEANPLLSELNISGLTNLISLSCYSCKLSSLDITTLSALTDLKCGNQEGDLTLTLTSAQNTSKWETTWKGLWQNNNITPNVKD